MKITLYQIVPKPENRYLIFSDFNSIQAASGGRVPAEIYEAVFSGDPDIALPGDAKNKTDRELAELEAVFVRFNVSHPEGFLGRSMTMSDVVEVIRSEKESRFFFCDRFGFEEIAFEKEKADFGRLQGAERTQP